MRWCVCLRGASVGVSNSPTPWSVNQVGQKHKGWVGWVQDNVLNALQSIWFNRGETKNRKIVAQKLRQHAHDRNRPPLLIFPEGVSHIVRERAGLSDLTTARARHVCQQPLRHAVQEGCVRT